MGRRPKYSEDFRHESGWLVLTTVKTMAEVARGLGTKHKTLGAWVRSEQ